MPSEQSTANFKSSGRLGEPSLPARTRKLSMYRRSRCASVPSVAKVSTVPAVPSLSPITRRSTSARPLS